MIQKLIVLFKRKIEAKKSFGKNFAGKSLQLKANEIDKALFLKIKTLDPKSFTNHLGSTTTTTATTQQQKSGLYSPFNCF